MALPPFDDQCWRAVAFALAAAHRAALVVRWREAQLEAARAEADDLYQRAVLAERLLTQEDPTPAGRSTPTQPVNLPRSADGSTLH